MSWRILYIEQANYLNLYLDNLKITKGNDEIIIPLSDINSVIIDNYKTTITTGLINKCMEYKINIVTCNNEHLPAGLIYPYAGNYQATKIQMNQISWKKENLEIMWGIIVKGKIINQIKVLRKNNKSQLVIEKMLEYIDSVCDNDTTNREGLAAKIYFRELFGTNFNRNNDDTINASLNYGYSIIRSMIARTLVAKGLNPHLGIFHKGPNNDFNLADDVIEVFRPIVDNYVYENFLEEQYFTREIRLKLVEIFSKKINYKGKKETFHNVVGDLVDCIIYSLNTGDITNLEFPEVAIYDL